MSAQRVSISSEACKVVEQLKSQHGELIFHQSGGCCDGSVPMCFAKGEFMLGSRDLHLGEINGCPFYMAADQFRYYENMHVHIDVKDGRGSGFSLEIPLGVRFISVSRMLSEEEQNTIGAPSFACV